MESPIIHNEETHQFLMPIPDTEEVAFIHYKMRDGKMYLVHSEVPFRLRGRGIGRELVMETKKYLESQHITAIPTCGYIRYIYSKLNESDKLGEDAEE